MALHDLYATSPKALGLVFHVEDVRELGKVQLGEVRVEADVVTEAGIEHRTTVMPVFANLDGEDRVEPTVEQTFLRFQAARAREEAVRRADEGDFDGAAASLRDAAGALAACRRRARARRGDRGPPRRGGAAGAAAVRRGRPEVPGRPGDGRARAQGGLRPAREPPAAAAGAPPTVTPLSDLAWRPGAPPPGATVLRLSTVHVSVGKGTVMRLANYLSATNLPPAPTRSAWGLAVLPACSRRAEGRTSSSSPTPPGPGRVDGFGAISGQGQAEYDLLDAGRSAGPSPSHGGRHAASVLEDERVVRRWATR